jgi:NAD(P)-dependent dehydrogenase (short-subunit alcohol dehydrogenase family)
MLEVMNPATWEVVEKLEPATGKDQVTEIANGALFLACEESSYATTSTFLVDGGLSGAYVTPE